MMDDPLSALDMHVADLIMSEGICGYVGQKTRVIVTNAIQHLKYADKIFVVDSGKVQKFDSLQALELNPVYQELKKATEDKMIEEKNEKESKNKDANFMAPEKNPPVDSESLGLDKGPEQAVLKGEGAKLETNREEDREFGSISWSTLIKCLKIAGGVKGILVMIILTGSANVGDYAIDWLTVKWTQVRIEEGDGVKFLLWAIVVIGVVRSILSGARGVTALGFVASSARRIHSMMFFKVLHAKLGEYLHRTSTGQIVNRFTRDMTKIDSLIGWNVSGVTFASTMVVLDVLVIVIGSQQILVVPFCLIFLIVAVRIQRRYMSLKRELTRLQGITSSPIIGWSIGVL